MQIWSAEIKELEVLYTSIKGKFPELERELEQLIETKDTNVILIYSRRCLEVIITELCECELKRPRKTEPLKGIIDKLSHEEKVPSQIIASMQYLNSISTFGAHPKDFDTEQVKPVLSNLAIIIKWYIKYKDTQTVSQAKVGEAKYESGEPIETKEDINKPRKRLIFLLSAIILAIVIVIVALFVFNIIGGGKQTKALEKSIAVLPFVNLSSDEEQVWFSDGITDIIISQLSKISDLRVLSRTSTLKYSEEQKSIGEIGKELGVNFIIEGTVQRQENKMRISVQLIRVLNEGHLWSDIYDREWIDIFDVQSEIAQRIAEELKTVLTPEEKEQVEKKQTENPEAYNLYLQGRFFWNKRTEEGLKKSVEYFEKAIAADPDYALAYAGLADAYYIQAWWGWIPYKEGCKHAKDLAYHALQLDKNLAEAHTVLGALLHYNDWNWEEARKELELAINLNPNFVTAHHYYSELLDILREYDESRKQINLALELDPYLPVLRALSYSYYYNEGKLNNSMDECNILQDLDSSYAQGGIHRYKFSIYLRLKEDLKAVDELQKALQMDTANSEQAELVNEIYNKSGINGILNWRIELQLQNPNASPLSIARYYSILDQKEEALEWLEKAVDNNYPDVADINTNPDYDRIRSESRFQALIKKMGLTEYAKKE
jgi:TolB-like protein/Tfp pilus assembly protein PilF